MRSSTIVRAAGAAATVVLSVVGLVALLPYSASAAGDVASTSSVLAPDMPQAIAEPGAPPVPAGWIVSPGTKSGTPTLDSVVGVSAPHLTHTAVVRGTRATYQWMLDGRPVSGETDPTTVPGPEALGRRLTLDIAFTAPGYAPRAGTFHFGVVALRAVPAGWVSASPRVDGPARFGRALTVRGPALTHTAIASGATVHYRWFVDGVAAPGATGPTWTPNQAGDLVVGVTVAKPGWKPLAFTLRLGWII
ncbi:MAG: hypothetical protein PIR53_07100 [Nocardioides alkalitolerans]